MPSQRSVSLSKRVRVELRVQVKRNTVDGEVYAYLVQNPLWSSRQGKTMLSQSAQAYWLAYARQSADPDLAKTTAIACIERMEHQIANLRRDFQLESAPAPSSYKQVDLEAALLALLTEIKRGSQSLNRISTVLSEGSGIFPSLTVLAKDDKSALIPSPLAASESTASNPKLSYTTEDLDNFLEENESFLENVTESLDL